MLPAPPALGARSTVARPGEPSVSKERSRRWYGWQTLTVDATWVLALGAGSLATKGGKNPVAGLVALDYLFGPPIVHFAHGHVGKGFGSMGLRVAPVVIGGLILWSANDEVALGAGLAAFFGGLVTAVAVDGAVIAREDVPADETSSVFLRLTPVATFAQNRGTVGVAGAF